MCDTLAAVGSGRLLFAKNSDRPPGEAQVVESLPRRAADPSRRLRTQYLDLGPDPGAFALVGSRPTWLWGLEHGVNEQGVAIGNEKIWTIDDPRGRPPALLGMDLVRLGLERAATAAQAVATIGALVEHYGQAGSGEADHDEPYHSAFLVADRHEAWAVETSDRTWAARRVRDGGLAISNRVSLRSDWIAASGNVAPGRDFDDWRQPRISTAIADHRLAATTRCVTAGAPDALDARSVVATLRDHGGGPWGAPTTARSDGGAPQPLPAEAGDDFAGVTVCMHMRDYQATTASMVIEARPALPLRAWCALGSPCVSIYVPCFPPSVPHELRDARQWQRFAALRDRVEHDAGALADVRAQLAVVEDDLWARADALDAAPGGASDRDAFAATAYARVDAVLGTLGV
jgi:secernin